MVIIIRNKALPTNPQMNIPVIHTMYAINAFYEAEIFDIDEFEDIPPCIDPSLDYFPPVPTQQFNSTSNGGCFDGQTKILTKKGIKFMK